MIVLGAVSATLEARELVRKGEEETNETVVHCGTGAIILMDLPMSTRP